MLLWEALRTPVNSPHPEESAEPITILQVKRLPFDKRCVALTRSNTRCKGRIRRGREYCVFHDPELVLKRKNASRRSSRRHLSHLPDGYLRKLTSTAAVGDAMNRLYREIRLGVITTEMGSVLFGILTRLFDSGLITTGPCPQRTRAARMRPKLSALLTRKERAAWRKAVGNATHLAPASPQAKRRQLAKAHAVAASTLPAHAALPAAS